MRRLDLALGVGWASPLGAQATDNDSRLRRDAKTDVLVRGLEVEQVRNSRLRSAVSNVVTVESLVVALLFTLWAICSPYFEIDRSGLIYAGRALADLDPAGVGRDLMFVHDGQSGFTIFTPAYRILASRFGLGTASLLLAGFAVVVSFFAAVVLASTVCKNRTCVLAITFAATLPACYGGYKIFSYAETAATPRPFAEAFVLLGIAALLRERRGFAGLAMLAAFVLHPIMALPGLMFMATWLAVGNRRLFALVAFAGLAALCVAVLHQSPFDRLFTPIDAAWKAVLIDRTPQIFPSLWPEGWMGRLAARVATLLIAASLVTASARKLFLVTVFVGAVGFAAAYLAGEQFPSLLIVQAQTWRAVWLIFSLACIAGAICVTELWSEGGTSRVVLALLALSWTFADHNRALILDGAALALHFCLRQDQGMLSKRLVAAVVAVSALISGVGLTWNEYAIKTLVGFVGSDHLADARNTIAIDWDYTPLAFIAAICVVARLIPARRSVLLGLTACGALVLTSTWDRRSAANIYLDSGAGAPDLRALVDTKPGEIFWLDGGRESWTWLGRPQWIAAIQGAGLIFSRPLSMLYRDRASLAIKAGLADDSILTPFADKESKKVAAYDPVKIKAFCAEEAAPAWLIAPTNADRPPEDLNAKRWIAPVVKLRPIAGVDGTLSWSTAASYDVIPCAR